MIIKIQNDDGVELCVIDMADVVWTVLQENSMESTRKKLIAEAVDQLKAMVCQVIDDEVDDNELCFEMISKQLRFTFP